MSKKTQMIGFKTTPEIREALIRAAELEDRTISYIINRILQEHFCITDTTKKEKTQ